MITRKSAFCLFLLVVLTFLGTSVHAQSGSPNGSGEEPLVAESGQAGAKGAAEHGAAEEGEGHGESSGWGTYWKPAVTQILGLLLLIFVYIQWVHPLLKKQHEDRVDRIQNDLAYIEEEKEEIAKQEQEIEEKMANIEKRAEEEREEILERGREIKEETIEEAEKHAEETIQNAREEAERIRERALLEIRNSMTESALEGLRDYFREVADEDLHQQFRKRLLNDLKQADSIEHLKRGDDGKGLRESTS